MRPNAMPAYFFLHTTSGRAWPTDDPHRWLLDHRDDPLLAAARERLYLSPTERDRLIRVTLRRCGLVLLHVVSDERVVAHHWSGPIPDLRRWAKEHGFNRSGVQVVLLSVKNGKVVVHDDGLDLLVYGERADDGFPWPEFAVRYEQRQVEEPDDQDTTSAGTSFIWPGVPPGRLAWRVLKSIWVAEGVPCPNCDRPLLVTGLTWNRGMLSFRSARVVRHCLRCRRRFEVNEERPLVWLASVLGPELRPTSLTLWRPFVIAWSDPNPRLI